MQLYEFDTNKVSDIDLDIWVRWDIYIFGITITVLLDDL